jgi:group I intron endonuclease
MKNGVIYLITSPSGRIYIGKTINLKKRIQSYKCYNCQKQQILCKSLKKYGWSGHSLQILFEGYCDDNELSDLEKKYIQEYNSFKDTNKLGMNMTTGGEGWCGVNHSDKTKLKISESRRKTGKTEPILKAIERSRGRKINKSEEWINNNAESIKKPILQFDLNGSFIKEWKSAKDVELTLGFCRKNISSNLRGKTNKAYNFIWLYKNSDLDIKNIVDKLNKKRNCVKVIDSETGELYETILESSKKNNIDYNKLVNMLIGNTKNETNLIYEKKYKNLNRL